MAGGICHYGLDKHSSLSGCWLAARLEAAGQVIVGTHVPLGVLAPLTEQYKIICLVRDRRDTIVSIAWPRPSVPNRAVFEKRLAKFWGSGGNPTQVAWWDSYAKEHRNVPHLLVRYENMLMQPRIELLAAWDYLQLSAATGRARPDDHVLDAALEKTRDGSPSSGRPHPKRRGIAGEWREHFSEGEGMAFYDKYMAATSHLGYPRGY